jgi:RimJ/RimL family protein N-acetyltransferase
MIIIENRNDYLLLKYFIQTKNLMLRPFNIEDAKNIFLLNDDPQVMEYTGDVPFRSIDEAKRFLLQYLKKTPKGLGRFAVIEKESEQFLGWCGLRYTEDVHEYDIGFRFFRHNWGQGIATESAKACIEYGFNDLHLEEIVGRSRKDNIASIRVLEKIGMTYIKDQEFERQEWVLYKIRP